jgi:hypothetical protein
VNPATERRACHVLAAAMIFAALAYAVYTTWPHQWPAGPDTLRDIASAETIRASIGHTLQRGEPLPDPYYRNEVFWYSPLMPALLAAGAAVTRAPMHLVAVRLPIFWNLAGPILFYMLACELFDPLAALAALALFLFVEPFASREAATYGSALVTSSFAQPFFYGGLLAWIRFRKTMRTRAAVLAGVVLGVSFLAHTVPTALLAIVFSIETIAWLWRTRRSTEFRRVFATCALVVGVGVICASPAMVPLAHYHMRIKELEPFVYRDPSVAPADLSELLRTNAFVFFFSVPALVGLIALPFQRESGSRRIVLTWLVASTALFFWAAYAVRLIEWDGLAKFAIAPAHHFMIYARAAESLIGGLGIAAVCRLAGKWTKPGIAWPLAVVVSAALVAASLPRYPMRDRVMIPATYSESQWAAVQWMADKSAPGSVFLAPENTGVSMIGVAGRHTVIVGPIFSNPYVDWEFRDRERQDMWAALTASNCVEFERHANPFAVTHLLLVDGMTPEIHPGACGFERVFDQPPFTILSRVPSAR